MADEALEVLRSIDQKLSAVVALLADERQRETEPGRQRQRNIDQMLTDQGLSGAQVGRLLGKSRQAVSQALARERKASNRSGAAAVAQDVVIEEQVFGNGR
jgi:hypothetical protein